MSYCVCKICDGKLRNIKDTLLCHLTNSHPEILEDILPISSDELLDIIDDNFDEEVK